MNKPNTVCRVCGKEYFCCADSRQIGSWRTMACSVEHYQEYMKRIEESRKPKVAKVKSTKPVVVEKTTEEIVDYKITKKIKSKSAVNKEAKDKRDE